MNKPVNCGCGGQPKVDTKLVSCVPVERKRVYCSKCYISTEWMKSEAEAVEIWNTAMRRAKVYILPNTLEDKGEMPFCPHCGDELEWE